MKDWLKNVWLSVKESFTKRDTGYIRGWTTGYLVTIAMYEFLFRLNILVHVPGVHFTIVAWSPFLTASSTVWGFLLIGALLFWLWEIRQNRSGSNTLDEYFGSRKQLFEYFGYVEDWKSIPVEDERRSYWYLTGEGHGDEVKFHDDRDVLLNSDGGYYSADIYTQRFLPKWVYPGKDFTMVCGDPHVDGNKFLYIFENSKRVTPGSDPVEQSIEQE